MWIFFFLKGKKFPTGYLKALLIWKQKSHTFVLLQSFAKIILKKEKKNRLFETKIEKTFFFMLDSFAIKQHMLESQLTFWKLFTSSSNKNNKTFFRLQSWYIDYHVWLSLNKANMKSTAEININTRSLLNGDWKFEIQVNRAIEFKQNNKINNRFPALSLFPNF